MSFYKYVNIDTLDKILSGSIKITQPNAFNDPFELAVEVYNPDDINKGLVTLNFNVTTPKGDITKYLQPEGFEDDNCNDIWTRELISLLSQKIGFLCLSRNSDSHLMWAHYADNYSGAVIEFDDNHEYFEGAFEISYVEDRPKIHMDYFLDKKEVAISELCIKSNEWSYEREWRLARSFKDCKKIKTGKGIPDIFTMPLPLDSIKGIVLGERCSLENAKKTFHRIKNTSISLKIAALANWKYEFRYETVKFNLPINEMCAPISPYTADIFIGEKGVQGEMAKWVKENHPMTEITKWRL
ncbi:DUF2971 domain-containing protein [Erwiniaceae bacterium BAC15a-03b]|uniref:DUF2971 domain-containing protein n=1 Tax=Winslowiella arboricola TaxID=2978220 RepID=A0A9J6PHN1_9GAMM|nr:DUF2971 domain-containing protein [Winslowiella arboricola]MCU5773072.1 DUF2971 domain-containing protein [Winslowiella arboricola]MCU5777833.1 DUF2971 domain-containing protein [Winslowiella arboricola]